MIGLGLKNLATENGMKVSKGVAYGTLKGYATTMNEGEGYKQLAITTRFADAAQKEAFMAAVKERDVKVEFRITSLKIAMNGIIVIFNDNPGTMGKIKSFIEWFYPLLSEYSVAGVDVCYECGYELTGGCWKLVNGMAVHIHEGCAQSLANKIDVKNEKRKSESVGSYGTGFIGALIGAIIGAILWGVVGSFGYISGLVAVVIGFLVELGYGLFKGKNGKGKIAITIITIILGVVLGNFIGDAIDIAQMLNAGELYGSYSDIPGYILYLLTSSSEYLIATLKNIGMGLLFAGAVAFALVRKTSKEVADDKIIDLD